VTRLAQVVFGVLVASAFAAFFVAQQLKTSPSVVQSFKLKYPVVSPNGDGRLDRERVTFKLKRADTVDVAVVNDQGDVVRELASGKHLEKYRQLLPSLAWDGLNENGHAVPDGVYRIRITLRGEGRSVIVPKAFRVDRTPPRVQIVSIGPDNKSLGPELLPHPSGAPARIHLSAPARSGVLRVFRMWPGAPKQVTTVAIPDGASMVTWNGTDAAGQMLPAAPYLVVAEVRDKAGNIGTSVPLNGRGLPVLVYGRKLPGRGGITIRHIAVQPPLAAGRTGTRVALGTDARGKRYTWTVRRAGAGVSRRGTARRAIVRLKAPGEQSGVYLYTARRGARSGTVPFAVDDRASHPVLVVLPLMTWQGRNPVDDDGDGRPNQLVTGLPVRLARVFGTPVVPGFAEISQPLLSWLDRGHHRYDVTTDVALAAGTGPKLRGHSGVLFAGDAVWLPPALQRRLRAFVTAGGTLASVGVGSFQRQARLTPRLRLVNPTTAASADIFGARLATPRTGVFDLTGGDDKIGLFRGTSGRFTGYSVAEETTSPGTARVLASAVDGEGATIIVALRVGRGIVIRFGLPELPARLSTDPDVQGLMGRTWDLLAR
jgi:FlgD Ig-like domain